MTVFLAADELAVQFNGLLLVRRERGQVVKKLRGLSA
jgi:hypothetical protein